MTHQLRVFSYPHVAIHCFLLLLALALLPGMSHGQSANDGFDPNADANVYALAVQSDGKTIVGGAFTNIAGETQNHIARLNADGSLDTSFAAIAVDNSVYAISVQADGRIVIGGDFSQVGTALRNNIARLNADGTLDTSFDPNVNGSVSALVQQPDGKLVMGGGFTSLAPNGGAAVTRNNIARLNANGTLDASFDPNANDTVVALALQPDGKLVLGGYFTSVAPRGVTVPRKHIALLNADGSLDMSFDPNANANGIVSALALQPDGKLVMGGYFTSLAPNGGASVTRNHIARLNANGTLDASFDPNANGMIEALALQPDGKLLMVGNFTNLAPNESVPVSRKYIARLNANGTLDTSFDPRVNRYVYALALQPDGKLVMGGFFTNLAPNGGATVTRNHIARLNADGTLDTTLDPNANGSVRALALQPNGKLVLGGNFTSFAPNGGVAVTRNRIARLNADGTVDTTLGWNANDTVYALAPQPDGKLVMAGKFTSLTLNRVAPVPRNRIARLNADDTLDTSFDPSANDTVFALALQPDGKLVVGGAFTSLTLNGGATVSRNHIARLNVDGTLDTSFDPQVNGDVYALALQPDGKLVVSGYFSSFAPIPSYAVTRNNIARLNVNGTPDASFDPNANGAILALTQQPDGKLLVGGNFSSFAPNGGSTVTRNNIARLNVDGTLDMSFDPNAGGPVLAMALQLDGKLVVGGNFSSFAPNGSMSVGRNSLAQLNADGTLTSSFDPYGSGTFLANDMDSVFALAQQTDGKLVWGGAFTALIVDGGTTVTRNNIARLSAPQAALQSLSIVRYTTGDSVITWARSGAGPELALPPLLEFSVAGSLYVSIGTMQRSNGGWRYSDSGFVPPSNSNFYLRTTGQLSSGYHNASSGLVQNTAQFYLNSNDAIDGIFTDGLE